MKIPPSLKPGDKIGIVAPARKISREELQPACDILQGWGLEVVFGKHLFSEDHQFSGTDAERTADLQQMLDDPEIKAVISARGGYGTVRIIDQLDFSKFAEHPKWLIGYSDVTVLHAHVHQHFGIETLHATMPVNFEQNKAAEADGSVGALQSMKSFLFGEELHYEVPVDVSLSVFNKNGQCEGILTGGNLSILYSIMGSSAQVDTQGKLLFIEDLDEYLYHIDRMMMSLQRGGMLSGLAGLIVGGMNDMNDNTIPFGRTAEEIIRDAVAEYDYPVCYGFPAGHIAKNLALPLGRKARLSINDNKVLLSGCL